MRWIVAMLALAAGFPAAGAAAQAAGAAAQAPGGTPQLQAHASRPVQLDTIVVSGALPGPGMWKVSKDGHVLWVLGTVTPLPRRMQWESRDVAAVLASATEIIRPPSFVVDFDVGFFQGLLLAPKALGARKNPDGKSLQDVVPADLYARWLPLKRKYIGRDRGVEHWRPLFAADKLYEEATEDAGLVRGGIVGPVIEAAIKARKPKVTSPRYRLVIADPKNALNEFRAQRLDDQACFAKSIDSLEPDLSAMRLRANAWAVGDIEALRALPLSDQAEACMHAALQADAVRKRGPANIDAEMRKLWLDAARNALAANTVSFAVLPIRELLKADGYLAALQAQGYLVEAPE